MKLVKFVPATLSALVLAACADNISPLPAPMATDQTSAQPTSNVSPTNEQRLTDASKTVVYKCQKGVRITAGYAFQGSEAKAVNLIIGTGKNAQRLPPLTRDTSNTDFTSFKSDQYVWNVENGFNFDNATTKVGGMLTQKGGASDTIIAKLCDVNTVATRAIRK